MKKVSKVNQPSPRILGVKSINNRNRPSVERSKQHSKK